MATIVECGGMCVCFKVSRAIHMHSRASDITSNLDFFFISTGKKC